MDDQMSDVRCQETVNRGSWRPPRRARGSWGRVGLPPSTARSAHDSLFTVHCFLTSVSQIEGAGESFPCRGRLRGRRPLKVLILFFKRPCEDTKGNEEVSSSTACYGTTDPRRGVRGERGQRPRLLCKSDDRGTKARIRVGEADTYPTSDQIHDSPAPRNKGSSDVYSPFSA
jgi:hypothetical protein